MPSRDVSYCCRRMKAALPLFIADFQRVYPQFEARVTSTIRYKSEQQALYAQGRTTKGPGVDPTHPLGRTVTSADGVTTVSNHQPQTEHGEMACHAADVGLFKKSDGSYVADDGAYEPFRPLAEKWGIKSGWDFPLQNPKFKADPDHLECDSNGPAPSYAAPLPPEPDP